MSPPVVEFFYGLGSRYSYLSATQLDRLVAETGCRVRWRPITACPTASPKMSRPTRAAWRLPAPLRPGSAQSSRSADLSSGALFVDGTSPLDDDFCAALVQRVGFD
jgi:hypothetical protein